MLSCTTLCYGWVLVSSSDIIRLMTNKPFEIPAPPGQRAPYFSTQLSVTQQTLQAS